MSESKKKRECPVKGEWIKRDECGRWRNRAFMCPCDCQYNLLARMNYEAFGEIELKVLRGSQEWLAKQLSAKEMRDLEKLARSGNEIEFQATMHRKFHYELQPEGGTLWDKWREEEGGRWRSDERVIWEGFRGAVEPTAQVDWKPEGLQVQLWEVRRILDREQIEVVELLTTERRRQILIDRALASQVSRFDTFVVIAYQLPHYWRTVGSTFPITGIGELTPESVFLEILAHLAEVEDIESLREDLKDRQTRTRCLLGYLGDIFDYQEKIRKARMMAMARGNAFQYLVGTYRETKGSAGLKTIFNGLKESMKEDVKEGDWESERWAILDKASGKRAPKLLGNVLYREASKEWKIEVFGKAEYERFKAWFEERTGGLLKLETEETKAGNESSGKVTDADGDEIPAVFLSGMENYVIRTHVVEQNAEGKLLGVGEDWEEELVAWIDEGQPSLGGKTPREAVVAGPEMRAKVVEMVKRQIQSADTGELKTGVRVDVNRVVKELGLDEIDEPPPPVRQRHKLPPVEKDVAEYDDGVDFDDLDWEEYDDELERMLEDPCKLHENRRRTPKLKGELNARDCIRRMQNRQQELIEDDEILDEMDAIFGWEIGDLCYRILKSQGVSIQGEGCFLDGVRLVLITLVNRRCRIEGTEEMAFFKEFEAYWNSLEALGKIKAEDLTGNELIEGCRQPKLLDFAFSVLSYAVEGAQKRGEGVELRLVMLVLLRFLVDYMDEKIGRTS